MPERLAGRFWLSVFQVVSFRGFRPGQTDRAFRGLQTRRGGKPESSGPVE